MKLTNRVLIVLIVAVVFSVVFRAMSMPLGVMETATVMLVTGALVFGIGWACRRLRGRKDSDDKKDE